MNELEHLLTVLTEECAEVAQRACKAARFGMTEIQPGQAEDNKRRLERELADLMATAELLGLIIRDEDKAAKIEKLKKFMNYSREIGTLTEIPKQQKGVFCLDHRKVMVDGICPICGI
jgi:NTP pyrophosphatase (non-canonical NTP hydrolase)